MTVITHAYPDCIVNDSFATDQNSEWHLLGVVWTRFWSQITRNVNLTADRVFLALSARGVVKSQSARWPSSSHCHLTDILLEEEEDYFGSKNEGGSMSLTVWRSLSVFRDIRAYWIGNNWSNWKGQNPRIKSYTILSPCMNVSPVSMR